jgi:hypothetical protein
LKYCEEKNITQNIDTFLLDQKENLNSNLLDKASMGPAAI